MERAEHGTSEATVRIAACRERAEAYDRNLAALRRKRATCQGGYLQAVSREVGELHYQWLLANQDLFAAEMSLHRAGRSSGTSAIWTTSCTTRTKRKCVRRTRPVAPILRQADE